MQSERGFEEIKRDECAFEREKPLMSLSLAQGLKVTVEYCVLRQILYIFPRAVDPKKRIKKMNLFQKAQDPQF